jgi:hypothetical protein
MPVFFKLIIPIHQIFNPSYVLKEWLEKFSFWGMSATSKQAASLGIKRFVLAFLHPGQVGVGDYY